jgi:hypothetical protein
MSTFDSLSIIFDALKKSARLISYIIFKTKHITGFFGPEIKCLDNFQSYFSRQNSNSNFSPSKFIQIPAILSSRQKFACGKVFGSVSSEFEFSRQNTS